MNYSPESRNERISFRTTHAIKQRIEEAIQVAGMGLNLTQFLESSALEKANRIIEHETKLNLSGRAREAFFYLLDHPRKPTKAMKDALKKYRELGLDIGINSKGQE